MALNPETLDITANRDFLLSCRPEDVRRKDFIIQRAYSLVEWQNQYADERLGLTEAEKRDWLNRGHPVVRDEWNAENYVLYDPSTDEDIYYQFLYYQGLWVVSQDAKDLRARLQSINAAGRLPNVDKIVCFGLGAPAVVGDVGDHGRAYSQFAAALMFADSISRLTHGRRIQVYCQDPSLRIKEIQALERAGIKIVNPYLHEGFPLIDHNAFVFSVHIDHPAKLEQMALGCSRPALILWTSIPQSVRDKDPTRLSAYDILSREYDDTGYCKALAWRPDFGMVVNPEMSEDAGSETSTVEPHLARTSLYIRKAEFNVHQLVFDRPGLRMVNGQEELQIDKVVKSRRSNGKLYYRVQWSGHPEDRQWYLAGQFKNSPQLLRQFHNENPTLPGPSKNLKRWERAWERGENPEADENDDRPRKRARRS